MMNYQETIEFLVNQDEVLSENVVNNMVTLACRIHDKNKNEIYNDMLKRIQETRLDEYKPL